VPYRLDALWLAGAADGGNVAGVSRPAHLAAGGVVVLGAGDDHVAVDVGPVGFRGRGGHGHVDALSFEARLGGRLVVPDSGTGTYTRDPGLRNRLRDGPAHTLVILDGRPYARVGGEDRLWRIDGDSPPRVLELAGDERGQRLVAEQDLPAAGGPARVRRDLRWRPGELRWRDHVSAPAGSAIAAYVQVPADARQSGPDTVEAGAARFRVELPAGARLELEPWQRSSRYDSVEPGARLVVRGVAGSGETILDWSVSCPG
jgi:hypothetical protein